MILIGRRNRHSDTQIRELRMRIMPAMDLSDWLGVHVTPLGSNDRAVLEVRFEDALQGDKEGRAVVFMAAGVAARRDLGVVNLDLGGGILRQRGDERVEQDVTMQLFAGPQIATQA